MEIKRIVEKNEHFEYKPIKLEITLSNENEFWLFFHRFNHSWSDIDVSNAMKDNKLCSNCEQIKMPNFSTFRDPSYTLWQELDEIAKNNNYWD